ncbi:RloB family protein [Solwaraspora sp. WMMD406]|uniref:RloB family protein n=1 Tax=Solwaraspora sp. WMMD406 TaxID=3016095 RepID=UPI002416C4A2|nr:RloB family protein [Solwaraspora sp. WMMD406]MDG4764144.1 RloB family protein [Solwaraspora sp. WMMD406]
MPGTGRETTLRRRVGYREQARSILIATNGESTERDYLTALKQEPWVHAGRVTVIVQRGSPLDVVKGAAARRSRDDYDEAWAVCDVDDYDTGPASTHADASDVTLLWSTPCFEVWLIMHKAPCTTYLANANQAKARLRAVLPRWDKTRLDFSDFRDGVLNAAARAKAMDQPPKANPATALWRLVEALRDDR